MAILFSFAACNNSSSSSGDDDTSVSGQGNSEAYRLSDDYFEVKDCEDGIFLECTVPGGLNRTQVFIDGIGQIVDDIVYNENKTKGHFFYPFLDPGKKYTVLVKFLRDEDFDEDGYCLGHVYTSDTVGWFETEVTAGSKSKGEVSIEDFGELKVEKNGDFKFTKMPVFHNENLLADKWDMEIGLNEGISWLHPDRRSKWITQIQIPCKKLGETYNFYTYPRPWGDVTKVDFIIYRPIMDYEYGEKQYRYQWDGYTLDTNCTPYLELWTNIDITKDEDVKKLQGTWTIKSEWDGDGISYHCIYTDFYTFVDKTVKHESSYTYTKIDGTPFTKEELYNLAANLNVRYTKILLSEAAEFEKELAVDPTVLKYEKDILTDEYYEYRIYRLGSNNTVSSDGKTLTNKYTNGGALSEYFADYSDSSGYSEHYDLKIFDDVLRIIRSGKDKDEDYEYYSEYKKQ